MKTRATSFEKSGWRLWSGIALFGAGSNCSAPAEPAPGHAAPAAMPSTSGPAPLAPAMATGEVTSTMTLEDGSVVTTTSCGAMTTIAADGTTVVMAADGTVTVITPDGMTSTTPATPVDGTPATPVDGTPATPVDATPAAPVDATPVDTEPEASGPVWINEAGRVQAAQNSFGIQGDWYAFGDGVTSTQTGNPYRDGKYCITGEADAMSANWGVGMGLDLNGVGGEKLPYEYEGKLTGFRIVFSGSTPAPARLHFVSDLEVDVNPFIPVALGEAVYSVADAQVPFSWGVDNAGQRVDAGILYAIQVLAPGDDTAGPIDLCIDDFEPIFDPNAGPGGLEGTTFINSDGFVSADSNSYGVTGPIYVISDGTSTTQTGVPFSDGKYCVAGTFTGAEGAWGAGLAFDLNHPPGAAKGAFDPAAGVAGFRVGLSGTTPGNVRIQFIVNEPQEGNQPFLVGQMNTSAMYPVAWAQVPTSWDVADAGLEVGASIYTMQVYLEGDQPGAFDVCVEELAPLSAAEMVYGADPASAGWNGFRTIDESLLALEYQTWKGRHYRDCGDGTACVPRDDGDCISEGVAYGMLLAVAFDDRDAFDKIWAYFKKFRNGNGVMNWQTTACGSAVSSGSATDGELDAAMALIQAACKWGGSYESDARTLIAAISTSEVTSCTSGPVLKPGDNFGGCDETNPSYVAPAYYKAFQALTGDSVWGELVNSGYALLAANQSRKGGVFSDWSNESGGTSAGNHSDDFGPDASRVPWRVATDYVWNGEPRAIPILDAFAAHVESQGGVARAFTPNSNFRGGSALSGIHEDAATAHEYKDAWLMTSVDDATYFSGTLRPITMLLAANRFEQGCN